MHIDIRGRNFWLAPALMEYVSRRVRFALGRFTGRVRRVDVRVVEVNGTRGGVDKRCRVQLAVDGRAVMVDGLDRDLYLAIDWAVERASRVIERLRRRDGRAMIMRGSVNRLRTVGRVARLEAVARRGIAG